MSQPLSPPANAALPESVREPSREPRPTPIREPQRAPAHAPVKEPATDPAAPPKLAAATAGRRAASSRATAVGDRIFASINDPAPEVDVDPSGALILIADDEPNLLISLEYLMKREGYRVSVARDGRQAIEAILRERPALVLLDGTMPKKSGFEVCQEVRANDAVRATLILMLTAKGRDTELAKGIDSGADAFMTKPFSTKELVVKVRSMLDARA